MTAVQIWQWLVYFYLYSFLGWVWESCFVSVSRHRWTDRGILHGPVLPVYGFGALAVLYLTHLTDGQDWKVFLAGMAGAAMVELVTGFVLDKLFDLRYWDYSQRVFNLGGYICLEYAIWWGGFSLLLYHVIHPFVRTLLFQVPVTMIMAAVAFVSVMLVGDGLSLTRETAEAKQG